MAEFSLTLKKDVFGIHSRYFLTFLQFDVSFHGENHTVSLNISPSEFSIKIEENEGMQRARWKATYSTQSKSTGLKPYFNQNGD